MEKNQKDDVQKTVEIIGNQKDVEHVMIVNKIGEIVHSPVKEEIGTTASINDESCQICHQEKPHPSDKMKVFTLGGERILRNVNPIRNSEKCYDCHDRKDKILGVLVVDTSLDPMDNKIVFIRNRIIFFSITTFLTIALILTLLLYILVHRPINKLTTAVSNVAEGKFDSKVDITSRDELGMLGQGFNSMTEKIAMFNQELQVKIKEAVGSCELSKVELMEVNQHLEKANQDLQKSQQQIIQTEKMAAVGQLASGVAHEINNPLGSILNYIKLSLKKIDASSSENLDLPRLRNYLATVGDEVKRCSVITKGLLDFSRMKKPHFVLTDIYEIINNALKLTQHQMYQQQVEILNRIDSECCSVNADPHQLQQVFINVILNALHAMSKGDTLEISYENKSKFIDICFKDSGCGISKGDLTRIFTPFFTTKKVGDGTGLGLSVAYGIIINHHGEIKVNSTQGKGTTVIISLPIVVNCIGQMA